MAAPDPLVLLFPAMHGLALSGALALAMVLSLVLRVPHHRLLRPFVGLAAWMARKLNRRRDTATRAWRGVIVLLLWAIPATLLGLLLSRYSTLAVHALVLGLLMAPALRLGEMWRLRRHAILGTLPLQSEAQRYLFNDIHGLLRYAILNHSEHFAIGVVGVAFWYMLGGFALVGPYLVLALLATQYNIGFAENRAFGGVVASLFVAADAIPRRLAALLLTMAGVLVPGCASFRAARLAFGGARQWSAFLARLLGIALGGPIPVAQRRQQQAWVGDGTAQIDAAALTRWLFVLATASLMLLVACGCAGVLGISLLDPEFH